MRRPRVYFSFRSPFSWLGLRDLELTLADAPSRFEYVPYWDPDERTGAALIARRASVHYAPMSKAKHLYILQDTKRLARDRDLKMQWPVDVDPWWEVPHLAWLAARRRGCERALYDALIEARWQRGEDICLQPTVHAAAAAAGLPAAQLAAAVEDDDVRAEAIECLVSAYQDDVFGIPYFLIGPHRFWGLDRVQAFVAAVSAAARLQADADVGHDLAGVPAGVVEAVGAYDRDTAGGCG